MADEVERNSQVTLSGVLEAALEIARERRETLERLKAALNAREMSQIIKCARRLCGLDEQSDRTDPNVN
jgi:hypothetical protein